MDGSDGEGAGESFLGCLAPKIKVSAQLLSSLPYPLRLSLFFRTLSASPLSSTLSASLPVCHHSCPTTLSYHSLAPLSPSTPNSSNPTRRINLFINNDLIN